MRKLFLIGAELSLRLIWLNKRLLIRLRNQWYTNKMGAAHRLEL